MNVLRNTSVLALASLALAAQAQVSYSMVSPNATFTLTTSTYVAADRTFTRSELSYAPDTLNGPIASVLFNYTNVVPLSPLPNIKVTTSNGTILSFYYDLGDFTTPGVHRENLGDGTLTVRPVPEPASLAALGLGAVAILRRRKRA